MVLGIVTLATGGIAAVALAGAAASQAGAGVAVTVTAVTAGNAGVAAGTVAGVSAVAGAGALALIGASQYEGDYSWDCWKQIIRDQSEDPSKGRIFQEIANDKRVKEVTARSDGSFVFQNIWNEQFLITPVILPWGQFAYHATKSN
eukprot:66668_1